MQKPLKPQQTDTFLTQEEMLAAKDYVHDLTAFFRHLILYAGVGLGLVILNALIVPDVFWAKWMLVPWGLALVCHAATIFELVNVFSHGWENRAARKRLSRLPPR